MGDIKEKLINAVNDGVLDAESVVEALLNYIDEDTVQDIVDKEDWRSSLGELEDNSEDEY
jgi:uncharacterized protein YfkK (UPF0435 family)